MVRILLWVVLIYLIWRIYRMTTRKPKSSAPQDTTAPRRFDNIQDADFKDVTNLPDRSTDEPQDKPS